MARESPSPALVRYANRSGDSGVEAFAVLPDALLVEFRGGALYRYGRRRPGPAKLGRMKALALAGRGLSTYISQHVGTDYEARLR